MNNQLFTETVPTKIEIDTLHKSKDSLFFSPILKNNVDNNYVSSEDSLFSDPILYSVRETNLPLLNTHKRDVGYSRSAWFIAVLVVLLIIFSKIRLSYSKLSSDIFSGFFRYRYILKIYDTKNIRNDLGYVLMNLLFLISIPLFIFQLSIFKGYMDIPDYRMFLIIMGGIMGFFASRILLVRFIGAVFKGGKEANEYIFNLLMHFKVAGIIIFPLTVCIPYIFSSVVPTLGGIGLLVIALAYFLSIFRGIKILYQKHVSLFYMILYLCALEIVPALIVLKFLVIK